MAQLELSTEDLALVRDVLATYLTDFKREVAGTENPEFRKELQRRQNALERILAGWSQSRAA
jgi:hypothetical protein